jgi:hypothetical protein
LIGRQLAELATTFGRSPNGLLVDLLAEGRNQLNTLMLSQQPGVEGCMRTVLPKIGVSVALIANAVWIILLGYGLAKLF